MCMNVSVFCFSTFICMHDSSQHARARTFRDYSHTLELRWWRVWRWFALAPHTIIHTNMHTCVYVWYIYIFVICLCFFRSIPDSSLANSLWLLDTGGLLWPATSCRPCQPAFLPGLHRLSEFACFWWLFAEYCACVKVLNVCECVYVWVCLPAVWSNIKYLLHMYSTSGLYIQAWGHTDVHVQTDRQTLAHWIDWRNSSSAQTRTCSAQSHTLEMRLSCGGHMHAHARVHACVLMSFLFFHWKHSRKYASLMCMTVSVFRLCTFMSMHDSCQHTRAHIQRSLAHPWAAVVTSVTLIRSSDNHTYKHAYLCVCLNIFDLFYWFSEYPWQLSD